MRIEIVLTFTRRLGEKIIIDNNKCSIEVKEFNEKNKTVTFEIHADELTESIIKDLNKLHE